METVRFHFDNLFFNDPLALGPYQLLQAGDLAAGGAYRCNEHKQKWHELSCVLSGTAIFWCNGNAFPVKQGDLIFNARGSIHAIEGSEAEPLRYAYVAFEIADCTKQEERCLSAFYDNLPSGKVSAGTPVSGAFLEILENFLNRDAFFEKLTEDALRRLLVYAMREFRGDSRRIRIPEGDGDKSRLLSHVCRIIDTAPEDIHILQELPKQLGYSYSYLSGLFSKAMGMSLRQYHQVRRHEQACAWLKAGHSVTAVAEKQGYGSVHAFSHAFAAREGVPPSIYTKEK